MFNFPSSIQKIFKDDTLQLSFEKFGFVIVDFYDETQMEELRDLYRNLHPQDEKGFFPSTFSQDKNYRVQADAKIREIAKDKMAELFVDYQEVCGSFIVKSPDENSGMCVHQDMSLVDESRFTGINIWTPLTHLSIENGTIFILPKSHRFFPTYRGSSIPEFFAPVMNEIVDYLQPVLIEAGKAVIFDQSIIHFSPPNFSNEIRIVTNIFLTNKNANFRTYFWENKDDKLVEVFEQSSSFMTDFEQFGNNIHGRPEVGKSLGNVPYDFPKIDVDFLEKNCQKTNARQLIATAEKNYRDKIGLNSTKKSWWQKFWKT